MDNLDDYTDEQLEEILKERSARRVAERLVQGTGYSADDVLDGMLSISWAAEVQMESLRDRHALLEKKMESIKAELLGLEEAEQAVKDDQESMTAWRSSRWAYR